MTRAEIEELLTHLGETTRDLQASGRLLREAAEHVVTVSDHLEAVAFRTSAAIAVLLAHLHGEDKETT